MPKVDDPGRDLTLRVVVPSSPPSESEAQMRFELDDGRRASLGIVVSLMDQGNGRSRLTMDDVRSHGTEAATAWDFSAFYTQKSHDNAALDDMSLSDDEYRDIGIAIVARLLALNGRAK